MLSQREFRLALMLGIVNPAHPVAVFRPLQVTLSQRRINLGRIDVLTGADQYGFARLIRLSQLVIKRLQLIMFNSKAKVLRRCAMTNMDWIRLPACQA